jgi:hypothetical protein
MLRNLAICKTAANPNGTVVIAINTFLSGSIEIPAGYACAGVQFPATWDVADLGFQVSTDGGTTFLDILDPNRVVSTTQLVVTPNFMRISGIPTAAVSFGLTPVPFHEIGLGMQMKFKALTPADDTHFDSGGGGVAAARTLTIWIGRPN